jgi:hypothetical protein
MLASRSTAMIARAVQMNAGFAWPRGSAGMIFLVAAIPMKWVASPETRFLERDESEDCCVAERDGSALLVTLATRATEWQGWH